MDYESLAKIGLKEEESHIYGYILQKGTVKAGEIAVTTGYKRGITYKILDDLVVLGLITKIETPGKITEFTANHPENLQTLLEQEEQMVKNKQETLHSLLPSFVSLYNLHNQKPHINFYEGESGVWKILNDSLDATEMIYQYVDLDSVIKHIDHINTQYVKKRNAKGIEKQGLVTDSPKAREFFQNYNTETTSFKILPGVSDQFASTMMIYDGKVSYISFKNDSLVSVIIEDSEFYKIQRALFEYTWKLTPRITPQ